MEKRTIITERYIDVVDFNPSVYYHSPDEEVVKSEFIGGWFPRRHLSILASKAGIGKTWYLCKLIADLSRGGTIWLQQSYYEPPRKVIFFVGETNVNLINERFQQMFDKVNAENVRIISYLETAVKKEFLDLDTIDGATRISHVIHDFLPDIVIFDTMMSFRRDDENSAQSTRDLMGRLQALAENNNCAILATHHLRKSDKKERVQAIDQDEIIGSSALVRMAGTAFIMTKDYKATKVTCVKSWWKNPPVLLYEMGERYGLVDFELADLSHDTTEARLRAERWIMEQKENGAVFTVKDVMDACNVGRMTAQNAINNKAVQSHQMGKTIYYK